MRGRWAWGWAVLFLACRPNVAVDVEVPKDVRYAAVLQLDGDTLVASTPLVRWSEDEGLPVFTDGSRRNVVVGFGALELPDDDRPFTEPLASVESACADRLPPPLWAADLAGASVDVASIGGLTAPWRLERCAPLDDDAFWIENLCTNWRCAVEPVGSTECTRAYSLIACEGPETLTVNRRSDGTLCEASPSDLAACPFVFHDAVSGPAPFSIERRVLVSGEDILPLGLRPTPADRVEGTMLDFAIVGDAILVSGRDRPTNTCEAGGATRELFVLDARDLALRTTIAVDGCLERLETFGDAVIAVGATGPAWGLYRYDGTGTRTATASIFADRFGVADYRVVDVLSSGNFAYVVFGVRVDREAEFRLAIAEVDPTTLETRRVFDRTEPRVPWRAAIRGDYLVAAGLGQQSFVEIGLVEIGARATSVPHEYTGGEINDLYVEGATLSIALRQVLHVYGDRVLHRPVFTDADVVAVHGWSTDLRLVVELTYRGSSRESEAVFYDERSDRLLPGRWPIGPSIAGRIRTDAAGRIVILMPWVGQIVRLTPTP